jgi:hypothetical protein
MLIVDFFRVLQTGQELANAEIWKKRQLAINALVVLITAGASLARSFGYSLGLGEEQIKDLAGGVYAVVGVFNAWATVATTGRIGLPPRGDVLSDVRTDGNRNGNDPRADDEGNRTARSDPGADDPLPYLKDDYRG